VTAAWLPVPTRLKLRGSYGTGFRSPSFLDLYGQSAYYQGNPHLQPERARGWDAGIDVYLAPHRGTVSATWFDTSYRDLIAYDFSVFPGTTMNVDRARTRGLELAAQEKVAGTWEARLAYTYLEADNLTAHTRLLRRPRHGLSADLWRSLGRGFSLGAGVRYVAQRQDVDAQTFATVAAPDYAVARVYAAWAATDRLTVKVRVENVFDRHYEEVNGYPALGAGIFGGIEMRF
jgi:vitamin B12 transporter